MFVDKAGELIADVMTMNRSLATIPSASAILDTSNYTFQAISYGKDAEGFNYHAHIPLGSFSANTIKVISYGPNSFSGYQSSATASALQFQYSLMPQSPTPMDTRLESKSTNPAYSLAVDMGQYINTAMHPVFSGVYPIAGAFPPPSGVYFQIFNQANSLIYSGSLQSVYNFYNMMDHLGFLKFYQAPLSGDFGHKNLVDTFINPYVAANTNVLFALSGGVFRTTGSNFPNDVDLIWILTAGDAGMLNLFGGIYHIGLWCFDIKEMLKQGYYPPYSFNTLNTTRKYRLFAKKTFNKDLLYYSSNSAFKSMFVDSQFSNANGIVFTWKIRFN